VNRLASRDWRKLVLFCVVLLLGSVGFLVVGSQNGGFRGYVLIALGVGLAACVAIIAVGAARRR
jgi:hypothetical protein